MPGNGECLLDIATGKDLAIWNCHIEPVIMPGEESGMFINPSRLDDHLLHYKDIARSKFSRMRPSRGSKPRYNGNKIFEDPNW